MPHIVLENINSTKEAFDAVEPFGNKTEGGILKVMDKYINASEQSALIESLAIENGVNQTFFVQLTQKKIKHYCQTLSFDRSGKDSWRENDHGNDSQTDKRYESCYNLWQE
jgi:hypothetical protein